jgi:RNA polymerase sigma-70 factor (ECF subfamily)
MAHAQEPAGNDVDLSRSLERAYEQALVARAVGGCPRALREVYDVHAHAVMRFAYRMLGDRVRAADVTQETFVRAYRRLGSLNPDERLLTWLFGIMNNVIRENARAARREGAVFESGVDARHVPQRDGHGVVTPEAFVHGHDMVRTVENALAAMAPERRAALLLRVDHGLSPAEIAGLLGCSPAMLNVYIPRARRARRVARV